MSGNDALNDEVEALTSIYDFKVLEVTSTDPATGTSAILALPSVAYTFSLVFPSIYPDGPPYITGTHHVDASARKGEGDTATNILREVLGQIFTPGQVCLFDLVEEATPLLTQYHELHSSNGTTEDIESRSATYPLLNTSVELSESVLTDGTGTAATTNIPPPNWILSESLVVSKSTFIARCLPVTSLPEARDSISHLLATNKKVASATHNITAWRIKQVQTTELKTDAHKGVSRTGDAQPTEIVIQDSDDDGETAAGGRLLHLMQLMDVWNVVVVVTRWYGGVKLGPDRFRCINAVAREALVNGGFVKEEKEGQKGTSGKKGKK
ncbi:hypothetical protein H2198_007736 [Neophaeococcomyces mojaviensis]|uniref:Uncharacterized protein n=1 Tax=Neophaeococcomyces mojaviensis TaxID=3383035 RepID=A0ACC2ZZL1_9EURO|nr:hypothetical protein H2198_007736 [Knufia sp. JES_112]